MKTFLIGFVIVVVAMALGVGASFGAATVVSQVAAKRLVGAAALGQSFRNNRQGNNRTGPGFENWAPFGGQNGQGWGQGRGMPGPRWNWNQNGQNGQNGQNDQNDQNDQNGQDGQNYQNGGCLNMGPGGRGMGPGGRMWPRR